jgi:hypothetical protein
MPLIIQKFISKGIPLSGSSHEKDMEEVIGFVGSNIKGLRLPDSEADAPAGGKHLRCATPPSDTHASRGTGTITLDR